MTTSSRTLHVLKNFTYDRGAYSVKSNSNRNTFAWLPKYRIKTKILPLRAALNIVRLIALPTLLDLSPYVELSNKSLKRSIGGSFPLEAKRGKRLGNILLVGRIPSLAALALQRAVLGDHIKGRGIQPKLTRGSLLSFVAVYALRME